MRPARGIYAGRLYAYGYQHGERVCKEFPHSDPTTRVKRHPNFGVDPWLRQPVQVSLGCEVPGMALPHPDFTGPSALAGALARFAMAVPRADPERLRRFEWFVSDWIDRSLQPLAAIDVPTFEEWLEARPYSQARKQQLLAAYLSLVEHPLGSQDGDYECKSFVKRETYPSYKFARAINSRSDRYKVSVGPLIAAVEKSLFALPWFIKKVPVSERARLIVETLMCAGSAYDCTDYTSFEASFTSEFMNAAEQILYKKQLPFLDGAGNPMLVALQRMSGVNVCKFKSFTVAVDGKRMSGDMCTSLGNSFTNLMLFLFLCEENGMNVRGPWGSIDVIGFVEGDDGIFRCRLAPPTEQQAASLGFLLKIEKHVEVSTASFCGNVADPIDMITVTNPVETIVGFGWALGQYAGVGDDVLLQLLSAKSLSYLHQYPGCPVIQALALYGKRVGKPISDKVLYGPVISVYERAQILEAQAAERNGTVWPQICAPPANTRALVAHLYGISVDAQVAIEKYLDAKNDLGPLHIGHLLPAHDSWIDYASNYVWSAPRLCPGLLLSARGELPPDFELVGCPDRGPDGKLGWKRVVRC